MKKSFKTIALTILLIFASGFVLPEQHVMPVFGATANDWHPKSFWYYPWGNNRVHKGVDVFAKEGTPVVASTQGLVLFSGNIAMGGNVVYMLGAKWRFHYFAHLQTTQANSFSWVKAGQHIGTVGSTGNAKGKAPHLHYSIKSLFPRLWKYNFKTIKSWDRLFYIDPKINLNKQD